MDSPNDTQWPPEQLDVKAFARDAAQLSGQAPLQEWERLSEASQPELSPPALKWHAQGELQVHTGAPDQVWLHLQVHAQMPLTCQRCLNPVLTPVDVDRSFRFVADEATAMALDDEAQEDLLVLSRTFNLLELVEDEVILATPLVPFHDVCPTPLPMAVADPLFADEAAQPAHPFAALAGLKVVKSQ